MEKSKKVWTRNISETVYKYWKDNEQRGDASKLVILTGASRPTIDRALSVGCVPTSGKASVGIEEKITKFFKDRVKGQQQLEKSIS